MIEALKKAQKDNDEQEERRGNAPAGQPQDPPLVDVLAELKMIRALQMRVNTRTARYSKMIEGEQADKPNWSTPCGAGRARRADPPRHARPADGEEPMRRLAEYARRCLLAMLLCLLRRALLTRRSAASGTLSLAGCRLAASRKPDDVRAQVFAWLEAKRPMRRHGAKAEATVDGLPAQAPRTNCWRAGPDVRAGRSNAAKLVATLFAAAQPVDGFRAQAWLADPGAATAVCRQSAAALRPLAGAAIAVRRGPRAACGPEAGRRGGPGLAAVLSERGRSRAAEKESGLKSIDELLGRRRSQPAALRRPGPADAEDSRA